MKFSDVIDVITVLRSESGDVVRWVDEDRFETENSELSPGSVLSQYGYWVIGNTIGGNALIIDEFKENLYYADHTGWYEDSLTKPLYNDYTNIPYSKDNVKSAILPLFEITLSNPVGRLINIREILLGLD